MNTKSLCFMTRIALVAMFAMGLLLSTGTVSAQKGVRQEQAAEVATPDMISLALDLKSATELSVFAQNGVTDKGNSKIKGRVLGLTHDDQGGMTLKAQKDLSRSFSIISQLPCAKVEDTDLSGTTFGPGVYCLSSAALAGEMVLDAGGNQDSIFIFRVAGGLRTEKGSTISLTGEARAHSVFFLTEDSATIGEGTSFNGSILARNGIKVGAGATVDGRVLSVKGEIELNGGMLGPQQNGILEVCKAISTTPVITGDPAVGLENRIFRFRVGGLVFEVPAGQCSGPQTVPSGPIVIEELLDGRTTDGGTFNGNFQLIAVNTLGTTPATAITGFNLPLRTANVTVREGGADGNIENQTRIQFVNRFAITGVVEICKESLDSGVVGGQIFNFTIAQLGSPGINPATGLAIPGPVFMAPVGNCTGPISVPVAADINDFSPRRGIVDVTEVARTGSIFTGADTADGTTPPVERLVSVNLVTRTVRAIVVEGGREAQTTIFFFNRSVASTLKVCKIAGPGVPELQSFDFRIDGFRPFTTVDPATGVVPPGSPGETSTFVSVLAGPGPRGFCQEVPGTFVTDSTARVTELPAVANFGTIRVSRIRSTSGILSPVVRAGGSPQGAPFFPTQIGSTGSGANTVVAGTESARRVIVPINREVTEVEFVNFNFFPIPLKICKVAGTGIPSDGSRVFTFDVVADTIDPDGAGPEPGLFAPFTTSVTVAAGPRANGQNGFCDFVAGPFTASNPGGGPSNTIGSFDLGSGVTVTERASSAVGTVIAPGGITSATTGIIADNIARSATVLGGFQGPGLTNGVNEIEFVNNAATALTPPKPRKRARMTF